MRRERRTSSKEGRKRAVTRQPLTRNAYRSRRDVHGPKQIEWTEAVLGLYNDAAYQEAKRIRQASTKNISMVLVEEFQSPPAA